jgi:hypothetical protein
MRIEEEEEEEKGGINFIFLRLYMIRHLLSG